jgi:hypothetical protein
MTEILKNPFVLAISTLMIGAYLEFEIWLLELNSFRDSVIS